MIIVQLNSGQLEDLIQNSIRKVLTETSSRLENLASTPEILLNVHQAGELLNLTVPTMYSKVSKNELPSMKRGNRLYFSKTELIEYLKAGKRKSSAEIEAEAEAYLSNKKSAEL